MENNKSQDMILQRYNSILQKYVEILVSQLWRPGNMGNIEILKVFVNCRNCQNMHII